MSFVFEMSIGYRELTYEQAEGNPKFILTSVGAVKGLSIVFSPLILLKRNY